MEHEIALRNVLIVSGITMLLSWVTIIFFTSGIKQKQRSTLRYIEGSWFLFSEKKPTEGDNIEVYYKNNTIINIDWQNYLYKDKEFKDMMFWRQILK